MHKKGILYYGFTMYDVSMIGLATIVAFRSGRVMLMLDSP